MRFSRRMSLGPYKTEARCEGRAIADMVMFRGEDNGMDGHTFAYV